ncbi:hypothetical protein LTR56_024312 [Elasticomyces elasticus]|nr:hypothetical protein LTR56_024312 [Elasticomyces elasticus]KAK4908192.1 hypothetical protein LTR49_022878 [Elasticomyces elasticus]
MQKQYRDISLHNAWLETFKHDGQQMLEPQKVADRLQEQGLDPGSAPGAFHMRPLVYKMLLEQVEKCGIEVEFGKRVVDYFESSTDGGVELEDGTRLTADIVVAADGRAMWRVVFPVDMLEQNPKARDFFKLQNDEDPIVRTIFAPGSYALTLTRKDVIVWIINHDVTGSEAESWPNTIEADEVLREMNNTPGTPWSSDFQDLVRCTPPQTMINFAFILCQLGSSILL